MKGSHPRPPDRCPFVLGHSISQVMSFMLLGMLCHIKVKYVKVQFSQGVLFDGFFLVLSTQLWGNEQISHTTGHLCGKCLRVMMSSRSDNNPHIPMYCNGPLARYVKLRVRMRRECRERFPRHRRWAIPTCITARASRTCRDACRDRQLSVSFEIGGGGKRSRHSRRMRNLQIYVSGKRPMQWQWFIV